jgi:5-methyltetrahydrofolate--homocysteine methyltransferase
MTIHTLDARTSIVDLKFQGFDLAIGTGVLETGDGVALVDPGPTTCLPALEAGLEAYQGKPLLNSVTGEEERLESVLPLVKKYGCAVVAISNDETGISEDPDERFAIAKKIVERAMDHGIPKEDVVVDPLIMPIGAINTAGVQAFAIMRRLKEELGVNSTGGTSNIGFGLPNRPSVNAAFLSMAARSGLTSAIMNPLHEAEVAAVMAADMMNGNDPDCARWLRRFREPPAEGAGEGRRGRREGRRRRREGAAVSA